MSGPSEELAAIASGRQRQAADPAASAWVAANAGTGKTKVLTDRVLNLLLAGTAPHRILCLTFTKAAAAEMANRLAQRLAGWAVAADAALAADLEKLSGRPPDAATLDRARRLFAGVLDVPGGMKIETIHAFCQALLRRFPLEAGVSPTFAMLDPRDEADLLHDAREHVLLHARDGGDPALAEALAVITAQVHESRFDDLMRALTAMRGRLARLFARHGGPPQAEVATAVAAVTAAIHQRLGVPPGTTPEGVVAQACAEAAFDRAGLHALAETMATLGGSTDQAAAAAIRDFLAASDDAGRVALFDAYRLAFLTKDGTPRSLTRFPSKTVREARPDLLPLLEAEQQRLVVAAERAKAATVGRDTAALLTLAGALLDAYATAKARRGQLDFDDLIQGARRLLTRSSAAAWVLFKLDGGLDHLLIDEAQDTAPDQWDVISALAAEFFAGEGVEHPAPRTLFVVGDRKQSIYSFQGADPDRFEAMRAHYAARIPQAGHVFHNVDLAVSFRSTKAVLEAVDAVFARPEAAAGVGAEARDWVAHLPFRLGAGGLVEVWPTMPAAIPEAPAAWKPPVERVRAETAQTALARLVARRIKAMVGGSEMLASRGRPVRPGDILVLVRRRAGFVEDLVRALKGLGVPVAGVDRMVLTDQLAVMDLLALAAALLLPEDDLTLATVLKGPLIGLSEEDLFTLAHGRPAGESLWRRLHALAEHPGPFRAARDLLEDLRARADFLPPHELFATVLAGPPDGRRKLLARLGPEAADPLDEFMALTLAFDRAHPPSLQAFLHWVEAGAQEIKRDLEKGAEHGPGAVRVMTVHGSKGLQAPVVFLPDTRQVPRAADPAILWQDGEPGLPVWVARAELREAWTADLHAAAKAAQEAEYRRLLYVALTRAEDRLYVCGWDGRTAAPAGNWYDLVHAGLAPLAETVEDPFLAADGALPHGRVLRLVCPQTAAVAPPPVLSRGDGADAAPPAWAAGRQPPPREATPPRPLAPSQPLAAEPAVRSPLDILRPVGEPETPGTTARFQRGRLIHRLLQSLPDLPPARRAAAAAAFLARPAWNLPPAEAAQYAAETMAVLDHPDFAPLFGPGSLAEVPLTGALPGGHVVAGQVDRLLVTPDAVTVVDFKTNRPPPRDPGRVPMAYLFQMAAYRAVLAGLYADRPVRCLLLWTDGPFLMELPADRLDAALAGLTLPET